MPPSVSSVLRGLLRFLLLVGIWYLAAIASVELSLFHNHLQPVWLPTGVGVAALLLMGPRYWPAIVVASVLADLGQPWPPLVVGLTSVGNALVAFLISSLLRRTPGFSPALDRSGDVLRFLMVGFAAPLISATLGVVAVGIDAGIGSAPASLLWRNWYLADVAGLLLVAPIALSWLRPRPPASTVASRGEMAALCGALGLATLLGSEQFPLLGLPFFPLVAWAAVRMGLRAASLAALVGLLGSEYAFRVSPGAAAGFSPEAQVLFLSALVLTQGVTALLLAASATEQRLSRAQERQVQEAYQALIARSPIAITGTDRQGRLTIWSRAAERLFGWSAAEAQGRGFPELLPSSDEEQRQLRERVLAGGSVTAFETVLRDREGRSLEVLLHAWPLYGPDGEPAGSMAAVQDITERKESERQQRAIYRIAVAAQATPSLQALYAAIHAIVAELMPAGNLFIALHDPATETISFPYFVNEQEERPAPRRLRGGLTEYVFRTGRPLRAGREQLAALITAGEVELIGVAPVDWMGVPLRAGDRRIGVLAVQSFAEGVHYTERQLGLLEFVSAQVGMAIERKRAEEALRASEAEFRALFAAMRDLIMVLDRDGRCLRIAPTSGELLDRPAAEIVGRALGEVLPGEAARRSLSAVRRALARGGPTALECIWTRRGEERWFQAVASPMTEDTVIFVARDVTEQRRAEEALRQRENELRQATKMEAVGRLAGGVAHDFNNLLTAVLGHAELALTRVPLPEALGDDLRQIRAAGSRAAGLTQQLLAFSRSQVLEPRIVELNDVITGLLKILRRTIGEDIELVTRLTAALDPVRADPVQLEQVLLNLIVNARDAMPQGGRLTIETSGIQLAGSPGVRIAVSDTGIGMSEEVLAHLFEPFFTTKEQGKGTGLGLATAYGIVQQSGGEISVRSEPGVGTTFHVDLPRADADAVADQETPVNGAPRPGWETLLLVEDDDAVRYLTRQVLELQGYHVLAAPGGEAALELSRRFEGPIHLLLTDVVMPQMSGPRLADLLTRQRPDLQVIYMSGYAAHEREHGTAAEAAFLQKPFTPDQLVRRIQAVFDGLARAAPPAPG